jgi:hypothetical protein
MPGKPARYAKVKRIAFLVKDDSGEPLLEKDENQRGRSDVEQSEVAGGNRAMLRRSGCMGVKASGSKVQTFFRLSTCEPRSTNWAMLTDVHIQESTVAISFTTG